MVEVTDKMLAEIGEPNRSRTAQGARSKAKAFGLGYRMNRIKTTDAGRALSPDLRGITGMIGPAGGE